MQCSDTHCTPPSADKPKQAGSTPILSPASISCHPQERRDEGFAVVLHGRSFRTSTGCPISAGFWQMWASARAPAFVSACGPPDFLRQGMPSQLADNPGRREIHPSHCSGVHLAGCPISAGFWQMWASARAPILVSACGPPDVLRQGMPSQLAENPGRREIYPSHCSDVHLAFALQFTRLNQNYLNPELLP